MEKGIMIRAGYSIIVWTQRTMRGEKRLPSGRAVVYVNVYVVIGSERGV
jgi:hypothetical protein